VVPDVFWKRTIVSISLGSSSSKRILGLLDPEDGAIQSCRMSVTAHPPTQYNIPEDLLLQAHNILPLAFVGISVIYTG
jgi:hypothetical protein